MTTASPCELNPEEWVDRSLNEPRLTRRIFLGGLGASLAGCGMWSGEGNAGALMRRSVEPVTAYDAAAAHMAIARADSDRRQLWGRLGGSEPERESSLLLFRQLLSWVDDIRQEEFHFDAHRPNEWRLRFASGRGLESAVPSPFKARFPEGYVNAPLHPIRDDEDWQLVGGRWAFVRAEIDGDFASHSVRAQNMYARAVEARAAGLIFYLPTPPGRWRVVVPVDRGFDKPENAYAGGRRPIPCFCIDADDGAVLERASATAPTIESLLIHDPVGRRRGMNVVGMLRGRTHLPGLSPRAVVVTAPLDGFYSAASGSSSALGVLVALAQRLAQLPVGARRSDIFFVGLSSQNDGAKGLQEFLNADPRRAGRISQYYALAHPGLPPAPEITRSALDESQGGKAVVRVGRRWRRIEKELPWLVYSLRGLTAPPNIVAECPPGLGAVCEDARTFSIDRPALISDTDRDTIANVSADGLEESVLFHYRLLGATGVIGPGVL